MDANAERGSLTRADCGVQEHAIGRGRLRETRRVRLMRASRHIARSTARFQAIQRIGLETLLRSQLQKKRSCDRELPALTNEYIAPAPWATRFWLDRSPPASPEQEKYALDPCSQRPGYRMLAPAGRIAWWLRQP